VRLRLLTGLVLLVIAVLTLRPHHASGKHIRLVPLSDIGAAFVHEKPSEILIVVGNVLAFAPFGALLRLQRLTLVRVALVGLGVSATIEVLQLAIPGRTTSVDDVLLNVTGTVLGGWLAARVRDYA
jgi:glycopeptide antibiotics resistance protein